IDRRVKQLGTGSIDRGCGVVLEEEEDAPCWHVKAVQASLAFFVVIEEGERRICRDGRDNMSADRGALGEDLWGGRHRQQAGGEPGSQRMACVHNIDLSLRICRGPARGLEPEVIFQGGLPKYNGNRASQKLRSTRG